MAATKPVKTSRQRKPIILTGNANRPLAEAIARRLRLKLGKTVVKTFSDGEIWVQIEENVRGQDVFVVQPTSNPAGKHFMELVLMIDALKRSSADRITAVLPYYGYARQDRKDRPRVPISAKVVAKMIERAGADRVLALDLHAAQIQGFFEVPVDHLFAAPVMIDYFKKSYNLKKLTVVSPDAGGVERARAFAKHLTAPLAIIDKRRDKPNVAEVMNIIGDVEGRDCLIVDDLIDTAGTLVKGANALIKAQAASVAACATHAVLSGPALEYITGSPLREVVFSDSILLRPEAAACRRIRILSVAPLLARAIDSIHKETSVSSLFLKFRSQL
jgi:ribose-phosphate pyrophosphokinase